MTIEKKELIANTDTDYFYEHDLNCNVEKKETYTDKLALEFNLIHNDHVSILSQSNFHSHYDQLYKKAKSQRANMQRENRSAHFERDAIKAQDNLKPNIITLFIELRFDNKLEKTIHNFKSFKDFRLYVKKLYNQSKFKNINLRATFYGSKKDLDFVKIATES